MNNCELVKCVSTFLFYDYLKIRTLLISRFAPFLKLLYFSFEYEMVDTGMKLTKAKRSVCDTAFFFFLENNIFIFYR